MSGFSRRAFLLAATNPGEELNDIHSQLNPTRVLRVVRPANLDQLRALLKQDHTISVSGSRHAMGGQQFGANTVNLDMRAMNRVLGIDLDKKLIHVEAGIEWPELLAPLNATPLGIFQKQTGADRLTLGGALSANVHGRGLKLKPIIDNVESFDIMTANGDLQTCSRQSNPELFRLAIGGYGLFGIITAVRLRLTPRVKVRRIVKLAETATIPEAFAERIRDGYLYGDFQFATDSNRASFLRRGVFSCCQPGYHAEIDRRTQAKVKATEMITEIYVRRSALPAFMEEARRAIRAHRANVVYGTVRLIEQDTESFLNWAKESYACVIFNLHITHDKPGIEAAARAFRSLIDLGENYYLTYHRWASREQVERCYPQFREFLKQKEIHDPAGTFQSEWYRHHKALLS